MTADDNRKGYPRQPTTLGEHIRKVRMDRGELQKDVAEQIGVSKDTICYWENGTVKPEIRYYSAIIEFLRFNPFPEPDELLSKLDWLKKTKGLSYKRMSQQTGIDPSQLRDWITGKTNPTKDSFNRIQNIFTGN